MLAKQFLSDVAVGIQLCALSLQGARELCVCPFSSRVKKPHMVFFAMLGDRRKTRAVSLLSWFQCQSLWKTERNKWKGRMRSLISKITKPKQTRETLCKSYFSYKDRKKKEINSCNFKNLE